MRDDQYIRLQQLEEKLTEQFLFEGDPEHWPGQGIKPKELTQEERGNRYWSKKNAVATISLTIRIGSLLGMVERRGSGTTPDPGADPAEGLLDAEIKEAEAEGKKILAKIAARGRVKAP